MPPFIPRSRKLRTALVVTASVVVVAVVALLLANTADTGNKQHKAAGAGPDGTSPTTQTSALKLVIGKVDIQNVGPPAKVRSAVRKTLLRATQTYVNDAILAPLRHGKVVNAYEKIFDSGVKGVASRQDRDVLTEGKTGVASGPVHATASRVRLDGLGDRNGRPAFVAASFTLNVNVTTRTGRVKIARSTELTFENEFGKWFVTAYHVGVIRTRGAKTVSASAHAGTGAVT